MLFMWRLPIPSAGDLRSICDAFTKRRKTAVFKNGSIRKKSASEVSEVREPFAGTHRDRHLIADAEFVYWDGPSKQRILVRPLDEEFHRAAIRLGNIQCDLRV